MESLVWVLVLVLVLANKESEEEIESSDIYVEKKFQLS